MRFVYSQGSSCNVSFSLGVALQQEALSEFSPADLTPN
jgi:hypothetical protein